jgi:hypothetical protein
MNQTVYKKALENGCSPKMAEMFACRQAPGIKTDTLHFRGIGTQDPFAGVHPDMKPYYHQRAQEAGVSPSGKRYLSSLAESPGDPKALVDSKGDIQRVCEERGWGCDGIVKTKVAEPTSDFDASHYEPAPDIVESRAQEIMALDGATDTCSLREWNDAKDEARSTLMPAWKDGTE